MGEHRRLDDAPDLRREVCSPYRERRSCGLIGLVAAALLMAAGIDAALWHHNLQRRQTELRAIAAEQRAAALAEQNQALRAQIDAAQVRVRSLHDELLASGRSDDVAPQGGATSASNEDANEGSGSGAKVRVIEVTIVPPGSPDF